MKNVRSRAVPGRGAFSRTDLRAVLVILAILSALLYPALARTHVNTQCLENLG